MIISLSSHVLFCNAMFVMLCFLYVVVCYCMLCRVIACNGTMWYGMVWHGMIWYGIAWHGIISSGTYHLPGSPSHPLSPQVSLPPSPVLRHTDTAKNPNPKIILALGIPNPNIIATTANLDWIAFQGLKYWDSGTHLGSCGHLSSSL